MMLMTGNGQMTWELARVITRQPGGRDSTSGTGLWGFSGL
jgi:hypothetical protein